MSQLSILWSQSDLRPPFASTAFVRDLRLDELICLRGDRVGTPDMELSSFFSQDTATLRLRVAMFQELLEQPGLFEALGDGFARLSDMYELQNVREGAMSDEQLLYRIRELEDYLAYLDSMKRIFATYAVQSELLLALWHAIEPLCTGENYESLCAAVARQSHAISNVRSITVGVNLDPSFHPTEAGVIAINEQSYVSGDLIGHLLRLNFKKDDYTCMAPLYPAARRFTPQEQAAMSESINTALHKVFGDSLKSWSTVIKSHVLGNLRVLMPLVEEWRFIAAAVQTLRRLNEQGAPLCCPDMSMNAEEHISGLYHPLLALTAEPATGVVRNALDFDADGRLYILTGPNSGGKSIYLQAVGMAYALLHLGLPLPAEQAVVCPVDGIFTHFADVRDGAYRHGRLGAECERIQAINRLVTDRSLILFDEALSGTNATEAVVISTEILSAYAEIGVRGIWVTHFHDLCRLPATVGAHVRSRPANLSAQLDEASHGRLFTIVRGDGGVGSHAMDIARSFRLTREEILAAAGHGQ